MRIAVNDLDAFPKPAVTVDLVLMTVSDGHLSVLLQKRPQDPFKDRWALPGGFVGSNETLDAAAQRVLSAKARLAKAWIEQLYTFGGLERDPRGRVITVAYFALMPEHHFTDALDQAADLSLCRLEIPWSGEAGGPVAAIDSDGHAVQLAFDHGDIVALSVKRLRGKLDYTRIGFALLPDQFTLRALQDVHEVILGQSFNKPAFRRRMLDKGWLAPTGNRETGKGFRPAELYQVLPHTD